jgi:basic amino acid/polyamine antiporter, APA family
MSSVTPQNGRALGFWSLFALGVNGIVGVGIFFVPSEVAARVPGFSGVWVYVATAFALAPVAWVYATLGGHFDEDGGPYVWARAAFGPTAGFAVGWIAYASALFSTSTVVVGLSRYAAPDLGLHGAWAQRLFIVACVSTLTAVVASGLKPSSITWNALTVLKLIPLVALAAFALAAAAPARAPHAACSLGDFGRAVLIAVFATQGFEIVPLPAGNARRSSRAVPAATLGSLGFAAALYVVLHWACVRALPNLAHQSAPLVAAAAAYGGRSAAWLVGAGTNVSALGIAFGMFAMTPRYLAALGRPDAFGAWVGRQGAGHVPRRALWLTSAAVLALSLTGNLSSLFVLSSVAVLAQYAVSAAALASLAFRSQRGLQRRQLWPAPLALVAIALLMRSAHVVELAIDGAVLAVGGVLLIARRALA